MSSYLIELRVGFGPEVLTVRTELCQARKFRGRIFSKYGPAQAWFIRDWGLVVTAWLILVIDPLN